MKNVWTVLLVRSVKKLRIYELLIPLIVRQHYTNVVHGGRSMKDSQERWETWEQKGGIGNLIYHGEQ